MRSIDGTDQKALVSQIDATNRNHLTFSTDTAQVLKTQTAALTHQGEVMTSLLHKVDNLQSMISQLTVAAAARASPRKKMQ